MKRKALLVGVIAVLLIAILGTGCTKLKARDELNKGVRAYKAAAYEEAVEHFKVAVDLDPTFPTARLYLATAYMSQYIPGAESPENLQMAQAAHEHFEKVLQQDPKNTIAIASIASLYFNQKKMDEAREWNKRLITADAQNKTAYYTLGVIAWTEAFQDRMEARNKLGMKPEDPGPLKDKKVREELRSKNLQMINDGIGYLEEALKIDPEYDDSMAYLNLLYRERADLQDTRALYDQDIDAAEKWVEKAMETKKIKAERMPAGGITPE